ncbi:hypothetical protein ACFL9T_21440 [Thermodesulfobacteriota bacterium]
MDNGRLFFAELFRQRRMEFNMGIHGLKKRLGGVTHLSHFVDLLPRGSSWSLKLTVTLLSLAFLIFGIMNLSSNVAPALFLIILSIGLWRMTAWARLISVLSLLLFVLGIFNPATASDMILRGNVHNSIFLVGIVSFFEGLFLTALIVLKKHKQEFRWQLI